MTKPKQPDSLTDDQVEAFIYNEINRKGIIFNDMIGFTGAVNPNPDSKEIDKRDLRSNRFSSLSEYTRMLELLTDTDCTYFDHIPPLRISLQDLFRFWYSRCVEKTLVVEMILEDIFTYFREEMRPPAEEQPQLEMALDFEHLAYTETKVRKAA